MMLGFIEAHRQEHGVEPICKVLPIAPSTWRRHAARAADPAKLPARAHRDAGLKSGGCLRRISRSMGCARCGGSCNARASRWRAARLMREMGLRGAIRGKPVKTTIADKGLPCPLDRQFRADRPDQLWLSDFTYVSTWSGFVYVAFIIDAFARRIVGWRVSRTADAGFVLDALEQALHQRRPAGKSGLHSDRGSQYLSIRYTERLGLAGIEPSVGSVGDSYGALANAEGDTTPWPKPSTVSTRPNSSTGEDHGNPLKPLNTALSNGSTGSTTGACSSPSQISHRPRPNNAIMTP